MELVPFVFLALRFSSTAFRAGSLGRCFGELRSPFGLPPSPKTPFASLSNPKTTYTENVTAPSIKQVISYCGLCGAEISSAGTAKRTPISKQRNRHLQTVLVEAAHLAPRLNPNMALLYEKEAQKGNRNRATLAVARKLVAYLLAVDRGERTFVTNHSSAAA